MSSAADPATLLVLSRLLWKFTFLCSIIRSHLYQFIWNKILEGFFLVWNCVFVSFYCGTMFLFLYTEELCFCFFQLWNCVYVIVLTYVSASTTTYLIRSIKIPDFLCQTRVQPTSVIYRVICDVYHVLPT